MTSSYEAWFTSSCISETIITGDFFPCRRSQERGMEARSVVWFRGDVWKLMEKDCKSFIFQVPKDLLCVI
jgi:hypothetical protein